MIKHMVRRHPSMKAMAVTLLGALVAVAALGCAAQTYTVTSSTKIMRTLSEANVIDADTLVRPTGVATGNNNAAAGLTCPGVEATTGNPNLRTALTNGHFNYSAVITEATGSSWTAGRIYRVQVYGDGVLRATLFFQNATNAAGVEGLTMTVGLGSATSYPSAYSVSVERLTACP